MCDGMRSELGMRSLVLRYCSSLFLVNHIVDQCLLLCAKRVCFGILVDVDWGETEVKLYCRRHRHEIEAQYRSLSACGKEHHFDPAQQWVANKTDWNLTVQLPLCNNGILSSGVMAETGLRRFNAESKVERRE